MKLDSKEMITKILFEKSQKIHNAPRTAITFTRIPESDAFLNNIEEYSHFFVLGCIMDQQISAERAWNIPYIISQSCGGTSFHHFLSLDQNDLITFFSKRKLHHFPEKMANYFFSALQIIDREYQGYAANIWTRGQPDCKLVIERFLRFPGIGQKISTMATNILVREFKVPLPNPHQIDISVDSQVEKVFKRLGLVYSNASIQQIIETARKIYPAYPGIADSIIWEIGRDWCKSDLSGCSRCYLNEYCLKIPLNQDTGKEIGEDRSGGIGLDTQKQNRKSSPIKPGKFRPVFEEIIRSFEQNTAENFYIKFTSSPTICVVKTDTLPKNIQYYFIDDSSRISVELDVDITKLPKFEPIFQGLAKKQYHGLPIPILKSQANGWLRLQFFLSADVSPIDFTKAMNNLIDQTYSDLKQVM